MSRKFPDVKPGDAVAVFEYRRIRKAIVSRVTPAQFVVEDGSKFMRSTGTKVGSGDYYRARAEPWAAEHDERLHEEQAERRHLAKLHAIEDIRWRHASRDDVAKAYKLLTESGLLNKEKP